MLLHTCLLLTCLSLAFLQRVSVPRIDRDDKCRDSDLHLIKEYFKRTTIIRNDTTVPRYCVYNQDQKFSNPPLELNQVIDLYRTLEYVNSYRYVDPQSPVTHDGVLSIDDREKLPLYQIADIRRDHLPCSDSSLELEDDVDDQMILMSRMNTDNRGFLLAHSLGGSPNSLNVIPMAIKALSSWRSIEDWIRKFLLHAYPNGRVAWKTAVQYEENVFVSPKKINSYRPLSFTVQYTAYTNEDDDNSIYYTSPQLTFLNHNDFSCDDKTITRSHDAKQGAQSNCDIQMPTNPNGTVGPILSQDAWTAKHFQSIPFIIRGKTYFYGQSFRGSGRTWFIQELLPDGQMGRETDHGRWNVIYDVVFPFFMNGTQYIYGHSSVNRTCMISKLLINGKIGSKTDEQECKAHSNAFPFTFNGKHYFYSQRTEPNNGWFIQELLPRGKLGKEVRSGTLKEVYPLLFRYTINNTQLFFAHNPESKNWFISQLLPDGEMVRELKSKSWRQGYAVGFSYARNGRHFMYGSSTATKRWFIQELLPNGELARKESSNGYEKQNYHIAFPFLNNGRQYIYKQNSKYDWKINELL